MHQLIGDMLICAGKFVTGILTPGSDLRKDIGMIPEVMRQARLDPRVIDAESRAAKPGDYWHDRTNRLIEYFRFFTKTWELQNSSQIMSGIVKFLSFLIVGLSLLVALLLAAVAVTAAIAFG